MPDEGGDLGGGERAQRAEPRLGLAGDGFEQVGPAPQHRQHPLRRPTPSDQPAAIISCSTRT